MRPWLVLAAIGAGFCPLSAHAEDKPAEVDTVVVTGTRTPERSQRSTVRTDVITAEEMEKRGATNVAEALATQPGLAVNPGNYGFLGGVSAVQIQGFDRDRVLILEDGERIVGDVGGAIDLANIPTADVSRIEIVYGPTSSLYGSAALGGVINIITAPPRDEGASGRAKIEGRSHRGLLTQGGAAYRSGDKWLAMESSFFRMDGIEKQSDLPDLRIPETSRRLMVGLRGGFAISPKMDVRVRLRAFNDRTDGIESQQPPGLARYVLDEPEETRRYTAHVIHVTDLGGGSSLRMTLGHQHVDNTTTRNFRNSVTGERHDRKDRMQSFEPVLTLADGKARTWVFGSRFEAEHFEQFVDQTSSTASGPVTTTAPEVTPISLSSAATYGQLQWKLGDQVTVLPGVRAEYHSRYGAAIAPRLAASYKPDRRVIVRVSGGRGYRAPSAKELGFVFDHSSLGYVVIGSPDLIPEKSWGVNGDVTVNPNARTTLRAGAYFNWVEDLIDIDTANGVARGNGVLQYGYKNFGRARTAGGELAAIFRPTPWFRADSSYNDTWTRDDLADQPLAGRPPHTLTSSVRIAFPPKLELYVRTRVVTSAFIDPDTRAPGYETIDLRLSRALWSRAEAYGGVQNLLDVRPDPGRVGDTRPPLGRILYLGLRAEFPWEDDR
jgi:outer membrane receptor for ferrienterochelin and colicins